MNKQKILNFEKINDFSYDNFFVSKSNFLAHKTLININQRERFIFLKGPKKSGKTHLGLIWKNINEAIEFNGNNSEEILNQKKNIFIDNFFSFINEEICFYIINHCLINKLKILISSNIYPKEYNFKIKDLNSRIKLFHLVEIQDPDDLLIYNLLVKLFHDKQIIVKNDEIFSYIVKRINRTFINIFNFVDKLDNLSLSQKRQITIPLIKELL